MLCSWASLTVPPFTQVYEWVLVTLMLGITLRCTSIPSRGGGVEKQSESRHATETGDKHWPDWPLGLYTDYLYM